MIQRSVLTKLLWCCPIAWVSSLVLAGSVQAQVTPDDSLGTRVDRAGNTFNITGGSTAGRNLFHSFREFSVPTGTIADFQNAATIQNIFSRVTGLSPSQIDGMIRAHGMANLFLLNPNGIVFGQDASLDVGGSFAASTASQIRFADGSLFSTNLTTTPPRLAVTVPVGLGLGTQPDGTIRSAANLSVPQDLRLNTGSLELQGQLQSGRNIILEAQKIDLLGDLSLLSGGMISSNANLSGRGNVTFASRADISIQRIATQGGSISLSSTEGSITTHSAALNTTEGTRDGGDIMLRARENIRTGNLNTSSVSNTFLRSDSGFLTGKTSDAVAGEGGDITVTAERGSIHTRQINSTSSSDSSSASNNLPTGDATAVNGGAITLNAQQNIKTGNINSTSYSSSACFSLARSSNSPTGDATAGNGGAITLNAQRDITTGNIASYSFSRSYSHSPTGDATAVNGGAITLNAQRDITTGNIASSSHSHSSSNNSPTGDATAVNGGAITLNAQRDITAGFITSYSFSRSYSHSPTGDATAGNGGAITLNAQRDITTTGVIFSSSYSYSNNSPTGDATAGNGGVITLNAQRDITTGSINSFSYSSSQIDNSRPSDGGDVTLKTANGTIRIDTSQSGQAVSIHQSSQTILINGLLSYSTTGNGGDIRLNSDGDIALPSLITTGRNRSGDIAIRSNGAISAGLASIISTEPLRFGQGGNIQIDARSIQLTNGAQLSASSPGRGQAGEIRLNADEHIELSGRLPRGYRFSTSVEIPGYGFSTSAGNPVALTGRPGSGAYVKAFGLAKINFAKINFGNMSFPSGIFSQAQGSGRAGDIQIETPELRIASGATIATTTFGQGRSGDINIQADTVSLNHGNIFSGVQSDRQSGNADSGSVTLNAQSLQLRHNSLIQTRAIGQGNGGNIQIFAPEQVDLRGHSAIISSVEQGEQAGNIDIGTARFDIGNRSDILATAERSGSGGNIQIPAREFVLNGANNLEGLQSSSIQTSQVQALRDNDRVDVSATSNVGTSGQINIPNLVALQTSLVPIATNLSSPEQVIAGSCLARRNSERDRFVVTGSGGLPPSPYETLNGQYHLSQILPLTSQSASETTSETPTAWHFGDPIAEARSLITTSDGHILLGMQPGSTAIDPVRSLICH